jgi:hypothetical protein
MPDAASIVASRSWSGFTVGLRTDGILIYEPRAGVDISIDYASQVLELGLQIAGGRTRPILVLMQDVRRIDREARAFFASDAYLRLAYRTALVVSSPVSRVIGNFFVGLNRLKYPCKVFDEQERAVVWLGGAVDAAALAHAHGKPENCTP